MKKVTKKVTKKAMTDGQKCEAVAKALVTPIMDAIARAKADDKPTHADLAASHVRVLKALMGTVRQLEDVRANLHKQEYLWGGAADNVIDEGNRAILNVAIAAAGTHDNNVAIAAAGHYDNGEPKPTYDELLIAYRELVEFLMTTSGDLSGLADGIDGIIAVTH